MDFETLADAGGNDLEAVPGSRVDPLTVGQTSPSEKEAFTATA
jgi:hypothetical protein